MKTSHERWNVNVCHEESNTFLANRILANETVNGKSGKWSTVFNDNEWLSEKSHFIVTLTRIVFPYESLPHLQETSIGAHYPQFNGN